MRLIPYKIPYNIGSVAQIDEVTRDNGAQDLIPFRSDEYPEKLNSKAVLEAHYSSLQTKLRLTGRSVVHANLKDLI